MQPGISFRFLSSVFWSQWVLKSGGAGHDPERSSGSGAVSFG